MKVGYAQNVMLQMLHGRVLAIVITIIVYGHYILHIGWGMILRGGMTVLVGLILVLGLQK